MRPKCPLVARVQELLTIDPAEGVLRWKVNRGMNRVMGKVAGAVTDDGENTPHWIVKVMVDGHMYGGHNLAWLLYYGECPSKLVDHLDNNSLNNRKINLRLATDSQNSQNRKISTRNTLGVKGLFREKIACRKSGAIRTSVTLNGKRFWKTFCIGTRSEQDAIERAIEWRKAKVLELHGDFGNHGEQSVVIDREAGTWAVS